MSTFDAKQVAKQETEARARGLTVFEHQASEAVDTGLIQAIVSDNRRSPANSFPLYEPDPSAKRIREEALPENIARIIVGAGGVPSRCPPHIIQAAQRLLAEGSSEGAVTAQVAKLLRKAGW
jgi:hypothetical protein